MEEKKLNKIINLKNKYDLASNITKQWLDYVYDKDRVRYSDDYYTVIIKDTYIGAKELTIHLPTVVSAMEKYTEQLYKTYKEELDKI